MQLKLLVALLLGMLISSPVLAEETSAQYAYMIDATTGTVLLDKNGATPMVPSSMSKLMTSYIAFSRLKEGRLKLDSNFTVSENAWRKQGSKTFVPIGGEISVEELLYGIIVQSGNDACIVMAEGISGSEEAFAKEMNRVAKQIGLKDSHFVNATGWPDEGHVMSPRDLATLAYRIITDFPEYYHFYSTLEHTYNKITQYNRNRLLRSTIGVDGLKTGHTEVAGYGITLSAKQGDRRLILVINGLESDDARVAEGDRLLRWGFREFENKTVVKAGQVVDQVPVWLGTEEQLALTAAKDITLTLPIAAQENLSFIVKYTGPIPAPIAQGTRVADLVISNGNTTLASIELVAAQDVAKRSIFGRALAAFEYYVLQRR